MQFAENILYQYHKLKTLTKKAEIKPSLKRLLGLHWPLLADRHRVKYQTFAAFHNTHLYFEMPTTWAPTYYKPLGQKAVRDTEAEVGLVWIHPATVIHKETRP